jgi:hypothetical protein
VNKDWLLKFLQACVGSFDDEDAFARIENFQKENPDLSPDEQIRRWVEFRLRETGVVFGTPLASEDTISLHTTKGYAQRRAVFLALLKIQADLAMEVGCTISHCTTGNIRVAELLVCFAVLRHRFKLARKIHEMIPGLPEEGEPPRRFLKLSAKVARDLRRQAYMAGNPLLGLPIHNSFNYVDAKTLGRIAVSYFERGMDRDSLQRVLDYRERERALLLRAMVGLTQADRSMGTVSLQVVASQIKSAGLPRKTKRQLLRLLKEPVQALAVAAAVEDDRTRDFLLEQVLLGAMLDGHVSQRETDYIVDLASWLGVSAEELAGRETVVMEFYEQHKAYLDMFTVGSAVRFNRQRMAGRLQHAVLENLGLIVDEIKGTRDLADLLYRASLGEKLNKDERKKMSSQLVSILRTVPSLAIFALPGGAFLLPLVYRLLPNGLKPKAFAERARKKEEEGESEVF